MTVRTRFAPSPTGDLHIGGARTALFCYLYARHTQGQYVLRIEDTDRERSTDASVQVILDGMEWLGLKADEGPVFQTDRMDRYHETIKALIASGDAYHCYCTREELDAMRQEQELRKQTGRYDGRCRQRAGPREGVEPVVRFRSPSEGAVVIDDLVQGPIAIANEELDDMIIARSDGSPTYNLTVVVDDVDMKISHVIRGDDHISNTPKQINIMRAMGVAPPQYAHVPMILGEDGSRLSKRHGASSVLEFRQDGILPAALLNYLVRLGWSHGDQELFDLETMEKLFDLAAINKSAARFDREKLLWFNQHYIQTMALSDIAPELAWHQSRLGIDTSDGPELERVIEIFRDRATTLDELATASRFVYEDFDEIDAGAAKKHLRKVVQAPLEALADVFAQSTAWQADVLEAQVESVAAAHEMSMGKIGQPLRVAVTGRGNSPGIGATLELVGQTRTRSRLAVALEYIRNR